MEPNDIPTAGRIDRCFDQSSATLTRYKSGLFSPSRMQNAARPLHLRNGRETSSSRYNVESTLTPRGRTRLSPPRRGALLSSRSLPPVPLFTSGKLLSLLSYPIKFTFSLSPPLQRLLSPAVFSPILPHPPSRKFL